MQVAPVHSNEISDDEMEIRRNLAAAYRLVHHFGWDDLIATHISARLPGPDHHFLINPFGVLFEEITASSLIKVDVEGNKVEPSDWGVNKAGFIIHSALHMAREDAKCIVHLHTIAGVAVASQEQGLLPLNQGAMLLNGNVAYHDFEGQALDEDERPRLARDLGRKRAMILRNHGTLTVGETVAEAFSTMYWLERACMTQVAAQGAALRLPGRDVQEKSERQAEWVIKHATNELIWPALLRLVERRYPDYRD